MTGCPVALLREKSREGSVRGARADVGREEGGVGLTASEGAPRVVGEVRVRLRDAP